jgi:hypothetical protein
MIKVYLISIGDEQKRYKIGHTRRKVEQRIKELKTGNSEDFQIVGFFESKWGTKIEASLHRRYGQSRIDGEWFFLTKQQVDGFISECQLIHDNLNLLSRENTYVIDRKLL